MRFAVSFIITCKTDYKIFVYVQIKLTFWLYIISLLEDFTANIGT